MENKRPYLGVDALKREVKEEIGVEIEDVIYTGRYYDTIGRHPSKTVICLPHLCKIKSGIPTAVSECDSVKWFSKQEIRTMELAYDHKKNVRRFKFNIGEYKNDR